LLKGLPDSALDQARQLAEQNDESGYLFTLDFPSYFPIVTYADDAELRREFYEAFTTRASDQGPNKGEWDNSSGHRGDYAAKKGNGRALRFR